MGAYKNTAHNYENYPFILYPNFQIQALKEDIYTSVNEEGIFSSTHFKSSSCRINIYILAFA